MPLTPSERDAKKLKKHLQDLTATVQAYLSELDQVMTGPLARGQGAPGELGRAIARLSNTLCFANDRARFIGIGIDFRTGKSPKKPKAKPAKRSLAEDVAIGLHKEPREEVMPDASPRTRRMGAERH